MPGSQLSADFWISEAFSPYDVWQHGVTRVLTHRRTRFQELYVVELGSYGKALILDGKVQTTVGDEFLYHEPLAHAPCVLHGQPSRVLIAGGADGGVLREVLKWNTVELAVVADIDGEAIDLCRELLPEIHQGAFDDPRARVVVGDAWELLESTPGEWDVVIADLTDPLEDGPAFKLFTREFFEVCQKALDQGGVFVNQAGSTAPPLASLLGRVVNTIGSVFEHTYLMTAPVPTYGSVWGLALASDRALMNRPDPNAIDRRLARHVEGELRMFDGETLLGLLQVPLHLRKMLAEEETIYTLDAPPRAFGHGAGMLEAEANAEETDASEDFDSDLDEEIASESDDEEPADDPPTDAHAS